MVLMSSAILSQTPHAVAGDKPIVARVDHVIVQTSDADALFAFLSDTLQLPVAWPLRSYGYFKSGGVFAGNVNIEVLQQPSGEQAQGPRLMGIAFEPAESATASLAALDKRDVDHGPIMPFFGTDDGRRTRLWSSVFLNDLGVPNSTLLICDYAWNVEERRAPLREELIRRQGGSLAVEGVCRITVGIADLEKYRATWRALLTPHSFGGDAWQCGDGPEIRLVPHNTSPGMSLDVKVASLERVHQFAALRDDAVVAKRDGAVMLTSAALGRLQIRLAE
jgi:hypothetical protein